ncbi:DUF4097 family beta strand repeat-containing protein [Paenibacillus sp. Marseille-Q4541]|uniref:DUF4097 family beta strand repeat-containing protein n=1 Tax=Paenibacillus sp. Marseille-Q4541 TaxID=2831522 RepID=UPI001BA4545B|nr:DUF4097 family beta strand repeat-containing protein [Paenibacillus sp. Marseille-Q4541]
MKKVLITLFTTTMFLSACAQENNENSPPPNDTVTQPNQTVNQDQSIITKNDSSTSTEQGTQTKEVNGADIRTIEIGHHYIGNIFIKMEPNTDHITATLNNEELHEEVAPELLLSTSEHTLIVDTRVPDGTAAKPSTVNGNLNKEPLTLSLIVPEKMYEQISLITQSGNITAEHMNTNTMVIKTDAGNLDMKQVNASKLNAESGAGNIFFKTDTPDAFTIIAGTGAGKLELLGEVIEQTESSEPDLTIGTGAKEARFATGAGNVRVYE